MTLSIAPKELAKDSLILRRNVQTLIKHLGRRKSEPHRARPCHRWRLPAVPSASPHTTETTKGTPDNQSSAIKVKFADIRPLTRPIRSLRISDRYLPDKGAELCPHYRRNQALCLEFVSSRDMFSNYTVKDNPKLIRSFPHTVFVRIEAF